LELPLSLSLSLAGVGCRLGSRVKAGGQGRQVRKGKAADRVQVQCIKPGGRGRIWGNRKGRVGGGGENAVGLGWLFHVATGRPSESRAAVPRGRMESGRAKVEVAGLSGKSIS